MPTVPGLDEFLGFVKKQLGSATARMIGGALTPSDWFKECQEILQRNIYASYSMGLGRLPTAAEERTIAAMFNEQREYLRNFYEEWQSGALSEEQALMRIGMYGDRMRGFVEEGLVDGLGVDLPQVPGDGGTRCLANCKCHLEFEQSERRRGRGYEAVLNVYWVLGDAEHCDDCVKLSQKWNPKVVRPGAGR